MLLQSERLEGQPTPNTTTRWQTEDEEKCILSLLNLEPIHALVGKKLTSYYPRPKIFPIRLYSSATLLNSFSAFPVPSPPPPYPCAKVKHTQKLPLRAFGAALQGVLGGGETISPPGWLLVTLLLMFCVKEGVYCLPKQNKTKNPHYKIMDKPSHRVSFYVYYPSMFLVVV